MSDSYPTLINRIGLQFFSGDPFWVLVREGIYQRAEQLPIDLVAVEVDLWQLPGDKQMEIIYAKNCLYRRRQHGLRQEPAGRHPELC